MNRRGLRRFTLAGILLLAIGLRFFGLTEAPPGINHDEASNGYDAYSILKTGKDRWAASWPVVLEGFGRADWRGALYAYLVVPCHAVVGEHRLILGTRLPAAILGVATVACLYLLVRRVNNATTALWAAFFLAVAPWHVQLSRFGHESSLVPACVVFALTLAAYGGFRFGRRQQDHVNPSAGAGERRSTGDLRIAFLGASGALFGLSLYAYPSMRLFTPALLVALVIADRHQIVAAIRSRRNLIALVAAVIAFCVVAAPMAYLMVTSWDRVMMRAEQVSLFHQEGSFLNAGTQFAANYLAHWGPGWLITHGDPYFVQWPGAYGQLNVVVAMLSLAGLVVLVRRRRRDGSLKLLLPWLLLYPVAASLALDGPHMLRSACGLPVFQWLAAVGAWYVTVRFGRTLRRRRIVVAAVAIAALTVSACCFQYYYRVWARRPDVVARYQQALCDAMVAIRPIYRNFDHIHISDQRSRELHWFSGEPYIIALLVLPIEPEKFHRWPKHVDYERPTDGFHRVIAFGPFTMTTRTDLLAKTFREHPDDAVLVVARPGEVRGGGELIEVIRDATGRPKFEIIAIRP